MADGDVQQPDCDLWDAVRKLLPAPAGWPPDSESLATQVSERWAKAKVVFEDSLKIVDGAADRIHPDGGGGTWPDEAGGFMRGVVKRANGQERFGQIAGALNGMAKEYDFYSKILTSAKTGVKNYVEDLSWQYTALGFNIPKYAKRNQEDFARNVAREVLDIMKEHAGYVKDPSTLPQPEDPSNNFFVGLWDSVVDQGKALAGLFGRGEDGSWSMFNSQVAWGHLNKLLASLAVYSMPNGLGKEIDDRLFNGVFGDYLAEAGKAFVDYDNWDNAPLHALGYTTGMVAGLLGPTRGVGAAVKLAGRGLQAPRVIKVGDRIGKFTLTHGAFKVIDKIGETAKPKGYNLHPAVTPDVARLIHDRPGDPPATGGRGPHGPEPQGPGPTKPPSPDAPSPEGRPSSRPPHDQPPTPPGHGERLLGESPRGTEPRTPPGDQHPAAKGDGADPVKREQGHERSEPPASRPERDQSPAPSESRQAQSPQHLAEHTPPPPSTADHAPTTRAEPAHSASGHESGRGADAGQNRPAEVSQNEKAALESPADRPSHTATGTPPTRAEVREIFIERELARMIHGESPYPRHVQRAWVEHTMNAGHGQSAERGLSGDAAGRAQGGKHGDPEAGAARKPPGRVSLEDFAKERFPDEYRKAQEKGAAGPHEDGPGGAGSPDRPSPGPRPSGQGGGAAHPEAARGGVALETRPIHGAVEQVAERLRSTEKAPAAAKASAAAPAAAREIAPPEPLTARPIPNKAVILHPDGTPEPLRPGTVEIQPTRTGEPDGPVNPGSPVRAVPGWAEPPRVGWAEPLRVDWPEPSKIGEPVAPGVGLPRPPDVGWPTRPAPDAPALPRPDHATDPVPPGGPREPAGPKAPSPKGPSEIPARPTVPAVPDIRELPKDPEIREPLKDPEVPTRPEGSKIHGLPTDPEIPALPREPEIRPRLEEPEIPADPLQAARERPDHQFRPWDHWTDPGRVHTPWPAADGLQDYLTGLMERNEERARAEAIDEWIAAWEPMERENLEEAHLDKVAFGVDPGEHLTPEERARVAAMDDYAPELRQLRAALDQLRENGHPLYDDIVEMFSDPQNSFDRKLLIATEIFMPAGTPSLDELPARVESAAASARARLEEAREQGLISSAEFERRAAAWDGLLEQADGLRELIEETRRTEDARPVIGGLRAFSEALREYARASADSPVPAWREVIRLDLLDPYRLRTLHPSVSADGHFDVVTQAVVAHFFDLVFGPAGVDFALKALANAVPLDRAALMRRFPGVDVDAVFGEQLGIENRLEGFFDHDSGTGFIRPRLGMAEFITVVAHEFAVHGLQRPSSLVVEGAAARAWADVLFGAAHEFQGRSGEILVTDVLRAEAEKSVIPQDSRRGGWDRPRLSPMARDVDQLHRVIEIEYGALPLTYQAALLHQLLAIGVSHERDLARIREAVANDDAKIRNPVADAFEADPRGFAARYRMPEPPEAPEPPPSSPGPSGQPDPSGPVTLGGQPPEPNAPGGTTSSARSAAPVPPPGVTADVWQALTPRQQRALADIQSRGLNAAGTLAATVAQVGNKTKVPKTKKLPKLLRDLSAMQRVELTERLQTFAAGSGMAADPANLPAVPTKNYLSPSADLAGPAELTATDQENLERVVALHREIGRTRLNPRRRALLENEMRGLLGALGLDPNQPDYVYRAVTLAGHPAGPVVWRYLPAFNDAAGIATTRNNLANQMRTGFFPVAAPSLTFVAVGFPSSGVAYAVTGLVASVVTGLLARGHEIGDDAAVAERKKHQDAQRQFENAVKPVDRWRARNARLGLPPDHGPDLAAEERPEGTESAGVQPLPKFYRRYGLPPTIGTTVGIMATLEYGPALGLHLQASTSLGIGLSGAAAAVLMPLFQWKRAKAKAKAELMAAELSIRALDEKAARADERFDLALEQALTGRPIPEPDRTGTGSAASRPSLPVAASATESVDGFSQIAKRAPTPGSGKLDPDAPLDLSLHAALLLYGVIRGLVTLPAVLLTSGLDNTELVNKLGRSHVDRQALHEATQALLQVPRAELLAAVTEAQRNAEAQRKPGLLRRLFGARPDQATPAPDPVGETGIVPSPLPSSRPGSASEAEYRKTTTLIAAIGGAVPAVGIGVLGLDPAYLVALLVSALLGPKVGEHKWRHRQVELAARNKKADADAVAALAAFGQEATALTEFLTTRLTEPFQSVAAEAKRTGQWGALDLLSGLLEGLNRAGLPLPGLRNEAGTPPASAPFEEVAPLRIDGDQWATPAARDALRAALDDVRRSTEAEQDRLAGPWAAWSTLGKRVTMLASVLRLVSRAETHLDGYHRSGAGPVQVTVAGLNRAVHDYQQSGPLRREPAEQVKAAREALSKVDGAVDRYLSRSDPGRRRPRARDLRAALDGVDEAVRDYRRPSAPDRRSTGDEAAVHKAIDRYQDLQNPNRHEPRTEVMRAALTELKNATAHHRDQTGAGWRRPDSATEEVRKALTALKDAIDRHQQFSAPFGHEPGARKVSAALTEIEQTVDRYRRLSAPRWREPTGHEANVAEAALSQVLADLNRAIHHYWQVSNPDRAAPAHRGKAMKAVDTELQRAMYACKKLDVPGMREAPIGTAPVPLPREHALSTGELVWYAPSGMAVGPAMATRKAHLRTMLTNRPDPASPYVVTLHDDGALPSPEELAEVTRRSEYYPPGRPVRLHSCGSASWARRFAVALGAPVVAPLADLHVLGRRTELPDGTVLPFGQEVVEGYAVGGGWAEFPPDGKNPIVLRSPAGSRPITLGELAGANPVALGDFPEPQGNAKPPERHPAYLRYPVSPGSGHGDGSGLFRATPLHALPAMDADTVDGRWKDAVAFVTAHFPQLPETNPGYYAPWADQLGYRTNCTRSVVHYVRRSLGEETTAPPVPIALMNELATLGYVMDQLGGKWVEIDDASYDGVISAMLARPQGALAAVNFLYEGDRGTIGSHVALVAHHRDGVVFLDPLTGWLTLLEERPLQIMLLPFPEERGW
ncbi:toxin glutamine deamidase domain-containing protein [Amycolatopsis sp. cmx-11-32]|uniref:WXG100-like domain-containing protein n=1 Tax=Amycolatopsis sp. cmx-11-32 TaxID=2785796 RepID=UPI0039E2AFAF